MPPTLVSRGGGSMVAFVEWVDREQVTLFPARFTSTWLRRIASIHCLMVTLIKALNGSPTNAPAALAAT